MIREGVVSSSEAELDFLDLLGEVWRGRWLVISFVLIFAVSSIVVALLLTEWYRSEVTVIPAEVGSTPSLGGQLGGLAALAGVRTGGGQSAEAVATLKSRELARALITDYDLVPVFFEDQWDTELGKWIDDDPQNWPDIRDAVDYFHRRVLNVSVAPDTGLVTVAVEWTNPDAVADWATSIVSLVNAKLRERALEEAERNVQYLSSELAQTSLVTLQQSIGRLLEAELQQLMLARGNEEFAFRVIDPAVSPKERFWPRRALLVMIGTIVGGFFGLFAVFVRYLLLRRRTSDVDADR